MIYNGLLKLHIFYLSFFIYKNILVMQISKAIYIGEWTFLIN